MWSRDRAGRLDASTSAHGKGGTAVLQRFWFWLFALYSAAALPLLAWALANLAA